MMTSFTHTVRCSERAGIFAVLAALLAGAIPALAGPAEDFQKLEAELIGVHEAYISAIEALIQKNPKFDPDDKSKLPSDKRGDVLQKMDRLAESSAKSDVGFELAAATLNWSIEMGSDESPSRFARIARLFPDSSDTLAQLSNLEYAYPYAGKPQGWITAIIELEKRTKDEDTRRLATFTIAKIQSEQGMFEDAKKRFQRIIKSSPDAPLTSRAKGYVFEIDHLQVGMEAPNFEATTIDGKKISLSSLRGKVVLIDFWATWCPSCIGEIPKLTAAAERFKGKFDILAVSADDNRDAIKSLGKSIKLPGIQTWDMQGDSYPVVEKYNIQGFPTWYLLDAQGIIRAKDPLGAKLIPAIEAAMKPLPTADAKKTAR